MPLNLVRRRDASPGDRRGNGGFAGRLLRSVARRWGCLAHRQDGGGGVPTTVATPVIYSSY